MTTRPDQNSGHNPLRDLAATGADAVIRNAIDVIRQRGWTQGVTCSTSGVDILGAILIAAGAPIGDIDDRSDPLETLVPVTRRAAALAAWHAIDAALGDALAWNDEPGRRTSEVVDLLEWTADRLTFAR